MKWMAVIGPVVVIWIGVNVVAAQAGSCTTNCYRTAGGGQTCNTYCF